MLPRRRCPFCRRWFHPHPRLKERQKTCGRAECRREQKRRFNQKWRNEHLDYFCALMPFKKKSMEPVPRKSVATARSIPTTYGATQFSFEIGASNRDKHL
jgi:hypothetical protein